MSEHVIQSEYFKFLIMPQTTKSLSSRWVRLQETVWDYPQQGRGGGEELSDRKGGGTCWKF